MIWKINKILDTLIIIFLVCVITYNFLLDNVYAEKIPYDFTMSTNPWPMTAPAGQPISWPFWVSSTSTSQTQVRLSCFVPSPASCNISKSTVIPNETVNVILSTSINSPNQYQVIVTGTSGNISHSSVFTVNINSYLPIPITLPPFVPMVPITLSPPAQGFAASMAIRPTYNLGDTLQESMVIQNISNKTIPAGGISGVVSIITNGSKVYSDSFRTMYNLEPQGSISESGTGISWNKGSWIVPLNLKPGWYSVEINVISKDLQQAQSGQIFFQILNTNSGSKISTVPSIPSHPVSNYTKMGVVFTDKSEFLLASPQDVPVEIFGNVENYQQQLPIKLSIENPNGAREDLKVYGTNRGDFQLIYLLTQNSLLGTYLIHVMYNGMEISKTSFDVIHEQQQTGSNLIPIWFKNPVKWWSDGTIDDSEFIQSLQFLLKHNLIKVTLGHEASRTTGQIPIWVKNNASLWSRNQISDMSFIQTIEYLISSGMIKI